MTTPGGKPDVLELARAQLDFAAVNAGAPSVRDVLFKAQTIVPLAPRIPWERYAKGAAVTAALAALLVLPWMPQQLLIGIAGLQFDTRLEPAQAQALVNRTVAALSLPAHEAVLSTDFTPQADGTGLLMLRATGFGQHSAVLQGFLASALDGAGAPPYATYPVREYRRQYRVSPLQLARGLLHQHQGGGSGRPAAGLMARVLGSTVLLREQLAADLLQHGYELTGFGFVSGGGLLPAGCQFTVDAWPQAAAIGVQGYAGLTVYQQREVQDLAGQWLKRLGLHTAGLQLVEQPTDWQPIVCEVVDRQGHRDELLTARFNAWFSQPSTADLSDPDFSLDQAVAAAAAQALPGIQRRVDFERTSGATDPPRFKVRVTMLGHADSEAGTTAAERPDPVENSAVRDEW